MSATDGFLSRWSRRKIEAGKPAEPDGPGNPELRADAEAGPAEAAPVPIEDVIAALPRIEELTAQTDLTQFLRAGIPPLLRREALRRMWSLDPAIRDFVGEARDYSYDWNVAGGVPVSGPLLPTDDAEATLSRMFSRLAGDAEAVEDRERGLAGAPPSQDPVEADGGSGEIDALDSADPDALDPLAPAAPTPGLPPADGLEVAFVSASRDGLVATPPSGTDDVPAQTRESAARHRRHGRAIPKLD